MSLELSPQSLAYVQQQVALGNFASEHAALEAAIAALRERHRRIEELRAMLQPAIDELDRGEGTPWDPEEIRRRGRELLAKSSNEPQINADAR